MASNPYATPPDTPSSNQERSSSGSSSWNKSGKPSTSDLDGERIKPKARWSWVDKQPTQHKDDPEATIWVPLPLRSSLQLHEDAELQAHGVEETHNTTTQLRSSWDDPSNPYNQVPNQSQPVAVNGSVEPETACPSRPAKADEKDETSPGKRSSTLKKARPESEAQQPPPADYRVPSSLQSHSFFIGPHVDYPCTAGDLVHDLRCGHKVVTEQPEICASNCIGAFTRRHVPNPEHKDKEPPPNARDLDKAFRCPVCVHTYLNRKYASPLQTEQVELVEQGKHWEFYKTAIGYVNDMTRKFLEVDALGACKRGRTANAVYDPVTFDYTGELDWRGDEVAVMKGWHEREEDHEDMKACLEKREEAHKTEKRSLWGRGVPLLGRMTSKKSRTVAMDQDFGK